MTWRIGARSNSVYVSILWYDTYGWPSLLLSVDDAVVSRAKRYAQRRNVSVSSLVETYLAAVVQEPAATKLPPILSSVRGILKSADPEHYRRYLVKKYR